MAVNLIPWRSPDCPVARFFTMQLHRFFEIFILSVHKVLAISPAVTSPNSNPSHLQKLYATSAMVGTIILTTWQIYGKMSTMYPFFKVTVSTLDVLGTLLMAIFDIIDTLNRTLLNQSHIRTFYKNLSKIDKFLGLPPTRNYFMSGVYSYKLTVIAMHVVIFATFSYDVYSTSFFYSWRNYKYNVFTFVLKYKITWFVVHLYMAACTIRRRFDLLNRTFVAAVRTTNGGTLAVKCMKCHDLLCDLVASINKVYGFQIMIMDKIVALSVVESSYLCLLFVIEARTKFSVVALATNLIWSADFMVSTEEIVLFFRCCFRFVLLWCASRAAPPKNRPSWKYQSVKICTGEVQTKTRFWRSSRDKWRWRGLSSGVWDHFRQTMAPFSKFWRAFSIILSLCCSLIAEWPWGLLGSRLIWIFSKSKISSRVITL